MNYNFSEDDVLRAIKNLSPEELKVFKYVVQLMASEIDEAQQPDNDVLFCGSNGKHIVKCLHYPREALGYDEPRQLPSANEYIILFACSDEFLDEQIEEIKNMYSEPEDQQSEWENYLNALAQHLSEEAGETPKYETLLENE